MGAKKDLTMFAWVLQFVTNDHHNGKLYRVNRGEGEQFLEFDFNCIRCNCCIARRV